MTRAQELTVLGAGPAGLAVGWYAQRAGISVRILERAAIAGGLCRTLSCGGHRYDTGAHRFHDRDPESTRDLRTLLGDELVAVDAPSQVRDGPRAYDFPPRPMALIRGAGMREAGRIGLDLLRSRLQRRQPVTFRDFAIASFGETLAQRILLSYTEKVWGLPADQLSPAVATRRLQGMTLRTLVVELLQPTRVTEHLDGAFLYPRSGYGRIVEALVAALPPTALVTGAEVIGFSVRQRRIESVTVRSPQGREESLAVTGRIAATLPLPLLARLLADELPPAVVRAATGLRFRDVRLVFLRLRRSTVSRFASTYLPDPALVVSRVVEPRNRSPEMAPPGETALVAEVPCTAGDETSTWRDDALAARVVDELTGVGLLDRGDVVDWRHHHLRNAYPIYRLGWEEPVREVTAALARFENLDLVGRNGLFLYSHLHDQLRFGRELVAGLVGGRSAPLRAAAGS